MVLMYNLPPLLFVLYSLKYTPMAVDRTMIIYPHYSSIKRVLLREVTLRQIVIVIVLAVTLVNLDRLDLNHLSLFYDKYCLFKCIFIIMFMT